MTKKILLVTSLVIISVITFMVPSLCVQKVFKNALLHYGSLWNYNAYFDTYEADFVTVKDFVSEQYSGSNGKMLSVSLSNKKEIRLYDHEISEVVDMPKNVASSLERIYKDGFPQRASFNTITIYKNRVIFEIGQYRYCLTYSPDEKPKWMFKPTEDVDIRVKSIGGGWYHVEMKN